MKNVTNDLESILLEGNSAMVGDDGEWTNFLPSARRTALLALSKYGKGCVQPILDILNSTTLQNPASQVLLDILIKLIPTRQTHFELILTSILPNWEEKLGGNPQVPLPEEFTEASLIARQAELKYPKGFFDILIQASESDSINVALYALKAIEKVGEPILHKQCLKLFNSSNNVIKKKALITASRTSSFIPFSEYEDFVKKAFDDKFSNSEKALLYESILVTRKEGEKFQLLDMQNELIPMINESSEILNFFLDAAKPDMYSFIQENLDKDTMGKMPESTLRRIIRATSLDVSLRQYASKIVYNSDAYNLSLMRSKYGLIAHRNSSATGAFVGHAGIFIDDGKNLIDCTIDRGHNAVQEISFDKWKDGKKCWGIREDDGHPVDLNKAVNRAKEIDSWRTEYDGAHNNQKGKWFKGASCAPKYWEADCVGFTEHCYEFAGGNPTPNELETGAGWPLTPREQRDNMRKIFDC